MNRTWQVVILIAVAAVAGLMAFLASWDIPPPAQQIEKVIPDDRFPR